jgi:hypothetical protein
MLHQFKLTKPSYKHAAPRTKHGQYRPGEYEFKLLLKMDNDISRFHGGYPDRISE